MQRRRRGSRSGYLKMRRKVTGAGRSGSRCSRCSPRPRAAHHPAADGRVNARPRCARSFGEDRHGSASLTAACASTSRTRVNGATTIARARALPALRAGRGAADLVASRPWRRHVAPAPARWSGRSCVATARRAHLVKDLSPVPVLPVLEARRGSPDGGGSVILSGPESLGATLTPRRGDTELPLRPRSRSRPRSPSTFAMKGVANRQGMNIGRRRPRRRRVGRRVPALGGAWSLESPRARSMPRRSPRAASPRASRRPGASMSGNIAKLYAAYLDFRWARACWARSTCRACCTRAAAVGGRTSSRR